MFWYGPTSYKQEQSHIALRHNDVQPRLYVFNLSPVMHEWLYHLLGLLTRLCHKWQHLFPGRLTENVVLNSCYGLGQRLPYGSAYRSLPRWWVSVSMYVNEWTLVDWEINVGFGCIHWSCVCVSGSWQWARGLQQINVLAPNKSHVSGGWVSGSKIDQSHKLLLSKGGYSANVMSRPRRSEIVFLRHESTAVRWIVQLKYQHVIGEPNLTLLQSFSNNGEMVLVNVIFIHWRAIHYDTKLYFLPCQLNLKS
jgi:hypothetical protein